MEQQRIATIQDIKQYMVLQSIDRRLFVVCDLFDGMFATCPSMSNHIYLKEVNKDEAAKKISIDDFKKTLKEGKIWVYKY